MRGNLVNAAFVIISSAAVVGCNPESSPNDVPVVGTWVNERCVDATLFVGSAPISMWAKGEYTFSADGLITTRLAMYSDSSCVSLSLISAMGSSTTISFEDIGTELMQDGLMGHKLRVQWQEDDAIVLDVQDVFATFPQAGRLCTSENLRLNAGSLTYEEAAGTQINYEECLVSGQLS